MEFITKNGNKHNFPDNITKDKHAIEGKLLSCLAKDITLFQDIPDIVDNDYFNYPDSKIFHTIYRRLYDKGYQTIDDVAINCEFPYGTPERNMFESIDGSSMTNKWKSGFGTNLKNFDKYKDDFLDICGKMKLYKSICEGKELLESHMSETVSADDLYRVVDYENSNSIVGLTDADGVIQLGIDDNFLEDCRNGAKVGIPYGLRSLSKLTMGFHTGNLSLLSAFTGVGKAQPLHSKIMTVDGYKKMGDIQIGDKVFDKDGKISNVIGIYPQGVKDNYRITFKDGSTVESCDEHLWNINSKWGLQRGKEDNTVKLRHLFDKKLITGRGYNYCIPVNKPLEFEKSDLYISPYILGCLIGDGYIKKAVQFSSNEADIVENIRKDLPEGFYIKRGHKDNYTYSIIFDKKTNPMNDELRKIGLHGKGSHEKFIPKKYLFASKEQRLELLKGLFDTDGSVNKNSGSYTYCTTSKKLKDDIIMLCHTLGYRCTSRLDSRDYKHGKCYILTIWTYDEIFKSEKHKSRVPKNRKVKRTHSHVYIKNIEYIGKEEMQCIMVDSPSHTYLTDNMTVTHNTTSMFGAWFLECAKNKEHIFMYSNETDIHDLKVMLLVLTLVYDYNYYHLTKNKLNLGDKHITDEDWKKIKEAQEKVNKEYMPYLTVKKPIKNSVGDFISLMRRYAYKGYKYFIFDTMKSEERGNSQAVGKFVDQSVEIYETAKKLDVHCLATLQLAIRHKENMVRVLSEASLAGARQIAEVCDIIMCARDIYYDEYSGEKRDIKPYRYIKNDVSGKYIREYVKLDIEKDYILFFLPKNRYGQKDVCVVYEKQGHLGNFVEVGFATVKD